MTAEVKLHGYSRLDNCLTVLVGKSDMIRRVYLTPKQRATLLRDLAVANLDEKRTP